MDWGSRMQLRRDEFIEFAQFLTGSIPRLPLLHFASSGHRAAGVTVVVLVEFALSVFSGSSKCCSLVRMLAVHIDINLT